MTDEETAASHRRVAAMGIVIAAVVALVALVFTLPESTRTLLIGETVEHCPESDYSCPSQKPGLLMIPMALTVVFLILFDDD